MLIPVPPIDEAIAQAFERAEREDGYVDNLSRLWAWRLDVREAFMQLRRLLLSTTTLSGREQAVMICAMAGTLSDAYCSMAWGVRLAEQSDAATAADVLQARSTPRLTDRERALADWARKVTRAPNETGQVDVEALRGAGLSDREIFEATVFVSFRLAFSTINDALGAGPDSQLAAKLPSEVRAAINYGRPVGD